MSLERAGVESPRRDAEILLCHFCSVRPHELVLARQRDFSSPELLEAVEKRARRIPLQYIIGSWSFMTEEYEVDENCLIPRQDTELLVETAIGLLPEGAKFIDLCTGSGCVAVSTLAKRADCRAAATDLFPETLEIAARNAKSNGVSDRFTPVLSNVMMVPDHMVRNEAPFDAVLSNPPYIRRDVVDTLSPEVLCEPRAALDGGVDGLDFYRAILLYYGQLVKSEGFFAFEIGYDQGNDIRELAKSRGYDCEILKDLGGLDRVAVLRDNGTVRK